MAKKKKMRRGGGALKKVGKITFLYFSGDVGEFIDALTGTLKDPKVRSQIGDAISQVGPMMQAQEAATAAKSSRGHRAKATTVPQ